MGLLAVLALPPRLLAVAGLRRAPSSPCSFRRRCGRRLLSAARHRPGSPRDVGAGCLRYNLRPRCYVTNVEVDTNALAGTAEYENLSPLPSGCSLPVVHLTGDALDLNPCDTQTENTSPSSAFGELPTLSEEEQHALAATPAHSAGLYALYVCYWFGNMVEQLWNFALPAVLATLHPSLLPVAVVGFFSKLCIFIGAPFVGKFMDHSPRVPMYNGLNTLQVATQLLSATLIIYAFKTVTHGSTMAVLLQPWFIILMLAGAIERLAGLALGVMMERDWVVLLAGVNRPVALAQANSMLNRLDLLCETAGASLFGILLSKFSPVTSLKIACGLMMCSLPIMVILGQIVNKFSCKVLDSSRRPYDKSLGFDTLLDSSKFAANVLDAAKHGWDEYRKQTVLPASVATVLLSFNVALVPGAIMTAVLMNLGISPSVIGAFSALCSLMGFVATFISARLVKTVGILKAGAAGLIFQAILLVIALAVHQMSSISQHVPLFIFLTSIVLSRLGHMSYDVVGTQILQTGIPASKANLIGSMEVSIASLAELIMLGMAIVVNDVSHYGFLAILSVSSVAFAAWMFCCWLSNPTEEQRALFVFDPQVEFI